MDWQYHVLKTLSTPSLFESNQNYDQFSSFLDTMKYNAHIPSPSSLSDMFNESVNALSECIEKKMGMYQSEILRQDLSFKVNQKLYNTITLIVFSFRSMQVSWMVKKPQRHFSPFKLEKD